MIDEKQIQGLDKVRAAAIAKAEAQYNYDRASSYGYPVKQARILSDAEEAYNTLAERYPAAAAYLKAQTRRRARLRILAGENYVEVMQDMKTE